LENKSAFFPSLGKKEASTDYTDFTDGRAAARSLTSEKADRAIHRSRFAPTATQRPGLVPFVAFCAIPFLLA
jgi:hypothetical protein